MKLLKLIREKNCSTLKLAKELGVNRQTIYNWNKGHATPNPQMILKIKEILNVSAEQVLHCFVE